jgi:hypothetical protein
VDLVCEPPLRLAARKRRPGVFLGGTLRRAGFWDSKSIVTRGSIPADANSGKQLTKIDWKGKKVIGWLQDLVPSE